MENLAIKYLDVVNVAILNDRGQFTPGVRVDFMVGTHGPYNVKLPQAGYTAQAGKAAVDKLAAEIRATLS
jgi:hypothetical protein